MVTWPAARAGRAGRSRAAARTSRVRRSGVGTVPPDVEVGAGVVWRGWLRRTRRRGGRAPLGAALGGRAFSGLLGRLLRPLRDGPIRGGAVIVPVLRRRHGAVGRSGLGQAATEVLYRQGRRDLGPGRGWLEGRGDDEGRHDEQDRDRDRHPSPERLLTPVPVMPHDLEPPQCTRRLDGHWLRGAPSRGKDRVPMPARPPGARSPKLVARVACTEGPLRVHPHEPPASGRAGGGFPSCRIEGPVRAGVDSVDVGTARSGAGSPRSRE